MGLTFSVFYLSQLKYKPDMIKKSLTVIIIFFLLPAYILAAEEYSDIKVIKSDEEGIVFRYEVPGLSFLKREQGEIKYDVPGIDKCPLLQDPGYPQVPARILVIGIPLEGEVNVRVLEENSQDKGKFDLPFYEGSPVRKEESIKKREEISSQDFFYPERRVIAEAPSSMRNQRIIRIKIFPVQYNPLRKDIIYYSDITIAVDFTGGEKTEGGMGRDLFENVYKHTLLNYEIARKWRKARETGLKKTLQENPFSYSDTWYKLTLRENGIYKIDGNFLSNAGINLAAIDPQKIRIFNGGGKALPEDNSLPRPELRELAILVSDGGDNIFNPADYILFYGWSVNNWDYDSLSGEYQYHINPYTRDNVFWITFTGDFPEPVKRMELIDGSLLEPEPYISVKSRDRIHQENDFMLAEYDGIPYDYFNWYWQKGSSFTLYPILTNVFPGDTAIIKVKDMNSYASSITLNSVTMSGSNLEKDNFITSARFTNLSNGLNTLQFNFYSFTYLDYYEVRYWKMLVCSNDFLRFENPDTSEVVEYRISGFNGTAPYLLEIDNKFGLKRFVNFVSVSDSIKFQDQSIKGERKEYYLLDQTKFKTPVSIDLDQMADLRNTSNQAGLLVITHSDFYDQLQGYKTFREGLNNITVKLVKIEDIYDEFSWGLFDPVAIRDYLKYAYENYYGQAPAYALLAGDGTYDYRNLLGTDSPNWIPPFADTFSRYDQSVSDDNYVYFGEHGFSDEDSNDFVDMFIGRLPVKTAEDMQVLINKIREYETSPELDTWKNLITLVADDEFHPRGVNNNESEHTIFSEILASNYIPKSFNLNKVYLMEYPWDASKFKPEAEDAIINSFNHGTVLINYMGHGNPNVWADEYVFKREQDIPRLENKKRLPLIYVASCSIGLFFSPFSEGMAEEFLRAEDKGAISVISATWLVYAWPNAALNNLVFDLLLSPDSLSISEALYIAKLLRGINENDRKYILLGDPLTFLASPALQVRFKELSSDTLSALSLVTFKGEVVNGEGALQADFDGEANLLVFDSEKLKTHVISSVSDVDYKLPGNVIFRGSAEIQNGEFAGGFIVPKDIGYGGENARINAYVVSSDSTIDGAGTLDSLMVAGTDTAFTDSLGPQISITFVENPNFSDGDTVQPDPILMVYITDPSGINLTGELGHGITLLIDDDWGNVQNLNSGFQYDMNSYTQGSLSQKISLKEGEHILKIKAWDNANNSSLVNFLVKVLGIDKEFSITQVMNYPNPFSRSTEFTYELSVPAEKVEIKIFTLSGRLIRILNGTGSAGFNSGAIWDGRDQDGDRVANGVYIYKVIARTRFNSGEKEVNKNAEVTGKAVVMN
ncbi:MAG: type IX secretion system sortase PorU [candidate division Zixibacteria bacterium]|nr:type IX secretion system sortase PorU [candidate division Zixibacteria bacterium]